MAPVLVGSSLKTYFSHARTRTWVEAVAGTARTHPAITGGLAELFVMPQFPSIPAALELGLPSGLRVGAQDLGTEDEGAFTGEVSGRVLAELGCTLVEVGHAERRAMFGETEEVVAAKTTAALRNGLTPVLCVGEPQRGRPAEAVAEVLGQIDSALAPAREQGLEGPVVVAYEPVWAIGAPEPAGADHIRSVAAALRRSVAPDPMLPGRVIYGGSAGPGLWPTIADSVDGMFLGRFAHDPAAVARILDEVLDVADREPR
ncbi:triose-phosphate isomerase family protein [Auraticoccus monumenti]|uniref:Triosephosphate isomerase n=1 Tax=Auraticoccus monumenti TaxID=675864 RepID=A0A1G6UGS5_9ACTN|nr:triose-phosphate isomerase family protein [Auraticoccus monumenti]SDD39755.1 triosephosphate isomerase [Auraticoccus monumenti]